MDEMGRFLLAISAARRVLCQAPKQFKSIDCIILKHKTREVLGFGLCEIIRNKYQGQSVLINGDRLDSALSLTSRLGGINSTSKAAGTVLPLLLFVRFLNGDYYRKVPKDTSKLDTLGASGTSTYQYVFGPNFVPLWGPRNISANTIQHPIRGVTSHD